MTLLKITGWLVFAAALLHLGIIVGGPDWYLFFGSGEPMAVMSEQGLWYPAIVTALISAVLFVWSLYAFSGAGMVRRLPLLKTALLIIGAIFLLRGLLAVPLLFFADAPYIAELKEKMVFMLVTSFLCLFLAVGLSQRVLVASAAMNKKFRKSPYFNAFSFDSQNSFE